MLNELFMLLKSIADNELKYIDENGFAHAGCNGPYHNNDTAVRNSGHFLILYSYLYNITNEQKYFEAAKKLEEYLLKCKNYGKSGAITHRTDNRFDHTNGLIGQAWTIEALVEGYRLTGSKCAYEKAKKLFNCQVFNYETKMWTVVDCDGEQSLDLTFNHQLWFAASGGMLLDVEYDKSIDEKIKLFLEEANRTFFQVSDSGRIVHSMNYSLSDEEKERQSKTNKKYKKRALLHEPIKVIKKKIRDRLSQISFTERIEEGYHLFDLYGFALLYKRYSSNEIFLSPKFCRAIEFVKNDNNLLELGLPCGGYKYNKFAYGYNSPAFEYPFVSTTFFDMNYELEKEMFDKQCELLFDKIKGSFSCCDDPYTLNARVYELVRFFELLEDKEIC